MWVNRVTFMTTKPRSKNSLSSIGWRRGPGRGGTFCEAAPLLLPAPKPLRQAGGRLPTPAFGDLRDWNISYFVGLDARQTNPQSLLTGDRNITNGSSVNDRILFLTRNHHVSWTKEIHQDAGNVA